MRVLLRRAACSCSLKKTSCGLPVVDLLDRHSDSGVCGAVMDDTVVVCPGFLDIHLERITLTAGLRRVQHVPIIQLLDAATRWPRRHRDTLGNNPSARVPADRAGAAT